MEFTACTKSDYPALVNIMKKHGLDTGYIGPEYLDGFFSAKNDDNEMIGIIGSQTFPPYALVFVQAIDGLSLQTCQQLHQTMQTWAQKSGIEELYFLAESDEQLINSGYQVCDKTRAPGCILDNLQFLPLKCQQSFELGKRLLS